MAFEYSWAEMRRNKRQANVQNHGLPKAVPCIEKLGGLGKVGHKLNRTRNPKSTAPLFILVTRLARENQNRHCALLLL